MNFWMSVPDVIDEASFQHPGHWQAVDDPTNQHRDEESQTEPTRSHHELCGEHVPVDADPLVGKGLPGAQRGDRIDDRRRQHICQRAGDRQSLAHQASDHRHHRAFADRKNRTEAGSCDNREKLIARQEAVDHSGLHVDIDEAADQRSQQNEGHAFEQNAQKRKCEILSCLTCHPRER